MTTVDPPLSAALSTDYFFLREQLTGEQLDALRRTRAFVDAEVQLYCPQLGRLAERGRLTDTIAGLAKLNNTRKARQVIADARDMLGGNGMLLENHVIRHMGDIEAIHTYEGTETMQALIVGRDITGIGAFA
jgi:alkylation response protein AidB-like acyl-CoA dehydrogenase